MGVRSYTRLKAPFPWYGGKSRVADLVWSRFGQVDHYIEPFAGSLAVLLARPGGAAGQEVVNDRDCYLANFWRALKANPKAVAHYADWPVNATDLRARHLWLVAQKKFRERMLSDPMFYDARIAGWWVWGVSMWIAGQFCPESGTVWNERPHLGAQGVNKSSGSELFKWMQALANRFSKVMVLCGDWRGVTTPMVLFEGPKLAPGHKVGIFLDPPYDRATGRAGGLYAKDGPDISGPVREWALEIGKNLACRVALCGLEGEHKMPPTWECLGWTSSSGRSSHRDKERIWFSPGCLRRTLL